MVISYVRLVGSTLIRRSYITKKGINDMNILINGYKLNDLLHVTNVQGVHDMPPARALSNAFAISSGSNYCGTVFDERVIVISCVSLMKNNKLLGARMDELKAIIAPTSEKELVFGAYPERYIKGRIEGSMNLEQITQIGDFDLTFYCSDPFYYDKTLNSASGSNVSLNNRGTWLSDKLTLDMSLNGRTTISNQTTGKSLVLNGSGLVTVDFASASISGGVAVNANKFYESGEFFDLVPGNNSISISSGIGTFRYRSCYL